MNGTNPHLSHAHQAEIDRLKARVRELEHRLERDDTGRRLLESFTTVTPHLDRVIGRSFIMAVSSEFDYRRDPDREQLDEIQRRARERDPEYRSFRDAYREGFGIRTSYAYQSPRAELYQKLPSGERVRTVDYLMPSTMSAGGLEIASDHRTAMYQVIRTGKPQSSVVPGEVLGAPLLSHAFPVFDDAGVLIGGVSFAVELTDVVSIARRLTTIVSQDDAGRLERLARTLSDEVGEAGRAADALRGEAGRSHESARTIREHGTKVIDIAEELNVLAINTAIQASKLAAERNAFGVIATKMKEMSAKTHETLTEIDEQSAGQEDASRVVSDHAQSIASSSERLTQEIALLFEVSQTIAKQTEELESLVRASIEGLTESRDELEGIYGLIDRA